jgi:hypothetical protein
MPLNLKRSVAAFFLVIFLFNVGGYHFVFWALKSNAKADLLHRLDADAYSSEDVVILTLPLSLPYPIHDAGYERADGEVEFGGEFYHMVKQKVENDTIFMVCIKDVEQKRIQRTINEYIDLAGSLPADAKNAIDNLSKLFKDYTAVFSSGLSKRLVLNYDLLFADDSFEIRQHPLSIDSPPPELG